MDINKMHSKFLRDITYHEMEVIEDNGLYRHVRFKQRSSYNQYFDLVSYPGFLVFSGDMGTYVFSRIKDMFLFFNPAPKEPEEWLKDQTPINPGYWGEKLQAIDVHSGYKEFDTKSFNSHINSVCWGQIIELRRDHKLTKHQLREVWEELKELAFDVQTEEQAYTMLYNFNMHGVTFEVDDFHFKTYSYGYLWACFAIQWGTETYWKWKQSQKLAPIIARMCPFYTFMTADAECKKDYRYTYCSRQEDCGGRECNRDKCPTGMFNRIATIKRREPEK